MNIDIGTSYETITWDEVKALPVFSGDTGLFDVGYRALFVPLVRTREQILEYVWDNKSIYRRDSEEG